MEVLLPMWAQVEMDDTLELLGPGEGYRDRRVRAHAVGLLDKADDQVSISSPFRTKVVLIRDRTGIDAVSTPTRSSAQIRFTRPSEHVLFLSSRRNPPRLD